MKFNLFGARPSADDTLRAQLHELEQRAQTAHGPGGAAAFYNRAGDLLVDAGRVSNALEYYGEAIDVHVKADRFEAGAAICRKVIRVVPAVVRTRCTLTWLTIGDGFDSDAQDHVETYVAAAESTGRTDLILTQLRRMSVVAGTESLRLHLAELLLMMGDETGADHLFGAVFRERNLLDPRRQIRADERRFTARRAALQGAFFNGG
jgi:hypothetical protein